MITFLSLLTAVASIGALVVTNILWLKFWEQQPTKAEEITEPPVVPTYKPHDDSERPKRVRPEGL